MKKKIKDLTDKEKLEILDYYEITKNFTKRNSSYKSYQFGNTFYVSLYKKNIFGKDKENVMLWLCMACGVSRKTIIDIMIAFNLLTENQEIEVEEG